MDLLEYTHTVSRPIGVMAVATGYKLARGGNVMTSKHAMNVGLLGASNLASNYIRKNVYNFTKADYINDAVYTGAIYGASNYVLEWHKCDLMYSMLYAAGMTILGEPLADVVTSMAVPGQELELKKNFIPNLF